MTLRRPVRRAAGLLALALALSVSAGTNAAQRQPAETGWTGTISVDVRGAGPMLPTGDGAKIRFDGRESTTYSLRGDGTASWTSTYSSRITTPYYTIPTTGSGGGHATVDIAFNGDGWGLGVDPIDMYDIRTDYTERNAVHFEKGIEAIFIELAKGMFNTPSPSPVQIDTAPHDPTGVDTGARGAANATTLSGSTTFQTESIHIGGFNGVPAEVTVRWNLTRAPVNRHVQIYGSECGCMTNDETEKTLSFTAGASPAGGEFSEFTVKANGKMPEVVSNNGGERPSLDITGTKDTGEVTLTIVYTRNGVRTTSAPFVVNFCAIEKIDLADDEHDIAFNDFDQLRVDAKAKAWRGGKDVSKELEWQIDEIAAPTSVEAQPSSKKGDAIRFTYNGLPRRNSDFGRKKLTTRVGGVCACQRDEYIRAFFNPEGTNNPDGAEPNWFFYWKQTGAVPSGTQGWLRYQAVVSDPYQPGQAIAVYDHGVQRILLSKLVFGAKACRGEVVPDTRAPTGRQAEGIDCFAETVKHEVQHRTDAVNWWGSPAGHYGVDFVSWFLDDWDHDLVPNRVETLLTSCQPGTRLDVTLDALKLFTLPQREEAIARGKATWFTCAQRPFDDVTDSEINAYWEGWKWPLGAANKEDWSCGDLGKQWKGKKCGQ